MRASAKRADGDRHFHPDMQKANALVRSGALVSIAAKMLPSISDAA